MKRFVFDAIKARLIERAKKDAGSATIIDDSAFTVMVDVISEGLAEMARYIEYDTMEKKWTNAQNLPSLTHMGKLIGRKRRRPTSSIGYVIVSHKDINGKQRLPNYGSYFFDLDQLSDFDNITQDVSANYIEKAALVPWTCSDVYTIPKGTIFTSTNNIPFISTEAVSIRILSTPYSSILASDSKTEEFLKAGGWSGIKYLKVPVIQGVQRTLTLGKANGSRFQAFIIPDSNVEGAYNSISREYFSVEVTPAGANTKTETWAEVQNIRLAGPYDKVYETKLSEDGSSVIVKFGDGVSGFLPPTNATIVVHYLETMGARGNLEQASLIDGSSFQYPAGYRKIDPRTNVLDEEFLYAINPMSISGGRDIEDSSEYRLNAPTSYLQSYTTAVKAAYEEQINKASPVLLSKIKCFPDSTFSASQVDTSLDSKVVDKVSNEISVISNALNVTAIKADGSLFDDNTVTEEFIQPVIKTIGDLKGPNDTLSYIKPNFIKIAPSIKVNTYDLNTTDADVRDKVSAAITAKYSIFNTDFKEPLYTSELTHQASLLNFTDSINLQVEALANVSMNAEDIVLLLSNGDLSGTITLTSTDRTSDIRGDLIAIPFNFDKIFASNKYKQGFKNYTVNSNFLLKVDINFINNPSKSSSSKTFFLYDNRVDTTEKISLQDAKFLTVTNSNVQIRESGTVPETTSTLGINSLQFADETASNFEQRQVRVAQFNHIANITDDEFMSKAKSWRTQPYENRPYEMDSDGRTKIFSGTATLENGVSVGSIQYKRNNDWWPYVDIIFSEHYEEPSSAQYASGFIVLPLSYLGFNSSLNTSTYNHLLTSLSSALKQFLEIKVYALPKQDDIEPANWNDIVFIDNDDIRVERNLKYKK